MKLVHSTNPVPLAVRIETFIRRSERGEFYEDFLHNAQVCMYVSNGTEDWLAELGQLLEACADRLERNSDEEVLTTMERLFSLFARARVPGANVVLLPGHGQPWKPPVPWGRPLKAYVQALGRERSREQVLAAIERLCSQLPTDACQLAREAGASTLA